MIAVAAEDDVLARRWRRIRTALDAAGFDALVVSDRLNFAYLTGYLSREFEKRFRHLVAVIDRNCRVYALVPGSEAAPLRAAAPNVDVRVYDTEPLQRDVAAAFVGELVGRGGVLIGAEMSGADRPCLTADFMAALAGLPSARLVDGSPILARARLLKDEAELGVLRTAAEIADRAWRDVLARLSPGVRVNDVADLLAAAFAAHGADYNFPGHIEVRNASNPASSTIANGQVLWGDFGVTVRGYHSDISRRAVMGAPTDAQLSNHAHGVELLDILIKGLRPGRRIGDAVAEMTDVRRAFDAGPPSNARFGHGLGLSAAEPPSLSVSEDAMVEAGMVLTPEPAFIAADGEFVHVEEMIAIDARGALRLSRGAESLARIGERDV